MLKRVIRKISRHIQGYHTLKDLPEDTVKLIKDVKRRKLTYLATPKMANIARLCNQLTHNRSKGTLIECGCALGGSAILIAKLTNRENILNVYDVFGMIPPPSSKDGSDVHQRYKTIASGKSKGLGGETYYGYDKNLLSTVQQNFIRFGLDPETHNINLIKGLVEDTLKVTEPVLFAHIDVDWYEPVMRCLERITPMLTEDGCIVLDDYDDWSGCRKATDDYFVDKRDHYNFDLSHGNLVITRK